MKKRACLCGRGSECLTITNAFHILEDSRSAYHTLPRKIRSMQQEGTTNGDEDPSSLLITNQLRAAYLRNILPHHDTADNLEGGGGGNTDQTDSTRKYIANHHFHPHIVAQSTDGMRCKLPAFVDEELMADLQLGLTEKDRVFDENGVPTGEYFVVPNYDFEETKKDLQKHSRVGRKVRTAKERATTGIGSDFQKWSNRSDPLQQTDPLEETDMSIEDAGSWRKASDEYDDDISLTSSSSYYDANAWGKEDKRMPSYLDDDVAPPAAAPTPLDNVNTTPGAPPSNMDIAFLQDVRSRRHTHLCNFETYRRECFGNKIKKSLARLESALGILVEGKNEVVRAERLILGSALASQTYATEMEAYLDGSNNSDDVGSISIGTNQVHLSMMSEYCVSKDPLVDMLCDTHASIVKLFAQNGERLLSCVAYEMKLFRQELETELESLVRIVEQLQTMFTFLTEQYESNVVHAWDLYTVAAQEIMERRRSGTNLDSDMTHQPKSPQQQLAKHKTSKQHSFSEASIAVNSAFKEDLWLAELPYLIAVSCQSSTWAKASTPIPKMIRYIREIELERRLRLQELLLEFVPRQKRLFSNVGSILRSPLLHELAGRLNMLADDDVSNTIGDELVHRIKSKHKHNSPTHFSGTRQGESIFAEGIDGKGNPVSQLNIDALESPITGDMVVSTTLLEQKTGKKASWQATLAVVTVDDFMHLFDIPFFLTDTPPELTDIFDAVASIRSLLCSKETGGNHKGVKMSTKNNQMLPSQSWFLPECEIKQQGREEGVVISDMRISRFSKPSRTLLLRARTKDQHCDWIDTILKPRMGPRHHETVEFDEEEDSLAQQAYCCYWHS